MTQKKSEVVVLRLTKKEKAILKQKATLYTGGNFSQWLRMAFMNYKPTKKDLTSVDGNGFKDSILG